MNGIVKSGVMVVSLTLFALPKILKKKNKNRMIKKAVNR